VLAHLACCIFKFNTSCNTWFTDTLTAKKGLGGNAASENNTSFTLFIQQETQAGVADIYQLTSNFTPNRLQTAAYHAGHRLETKQNKTKRMGSIRTLLKVSEQWLLFKDAVFSNLTERFSCLWRRKLSSCPELTISPTFFFCLPNRFFIPRLLQFPVFIKSTYTSLPPVPHVLMYSSTLTSRFLRTICRELFYLIAYRTQGLRHSNFFVCDIFFTLSPYTTTKT
jgi:hypothetical protein